MTGFTALLIGEWSEVFMPPIGTDCETLTSAPNTQIVVSSLATHAVLLSAEYFSGDRHRADGVGPTGIERYRLGQFCLRDSVIAHRNEMRPKLVRPMHRNQGRHRDKTRKDPGSSRAAAQRPGGKAP
jgi:hypothetical protein